MSIHRRAAKRDAVAKEIVATLRAHGCVVWEVSGTGIPDLIVLKNGRTWLADTKSATGKATPAQEKKWEEAATKARVSAFILRTPADAVAMINSALPPWEPSAEVMARAAGLPTTRRPSTRRCGKTGCKRMHPCPFHEAMPGDGLRDLVTRFPAAHYTPPRQPPGDARLAEVFAPPCGNCAGIQPETCPAWLHGAASTCNWGHPDCVIAHPVPKADVP